MEKLISLIFSNFFVIIIVVAGIANFIKKITGSDFKPDVEGKNQRPFKEPSKKFKIFDFDLEKWLEEQSGQQGKQRNIQSLPKSSGRAEIRNSKNSDMGTGEMQKPSPYLENYLKTNDAFSGINSSSLEKEDEKNFEVDMSDLQRSVVMAEVLGPPRSKRKTIRY